MVDFAGRSFHDGPSLAEVLRRDLDHPFVADPGDPDGQTPWDWLRRFGEDDEVAQRLIGAAFAELLDDPDPAPAYVIAKIRTLGFDVTGPISARLATVGPALSTRADPSRTTGESYLADLVSALALHGSRSPRLDDATVSFLETLSDRDQGWPWNAVLLASARPDSHSESLAAAIPDLTDVELREVVETMIATGPPLTEAGFDAIGALDPTSRQAVAEAVKETLDTLEQRRQMVLRMNLSPEMKRRFLEREQRRQAEGDPWPGWAARLNVPV